MATAEQLRKRAKRRSVTIQSSHRCCYRSCHLGGSVERAIQPDPSEHDERFFVSGT